MSRVDVKNSFRNKKSVMSDSGVIKLPPGEVLNLKCILTGGQSFRWKSVQNDETSYIGCAHDIAWKLYLVHGGSSLGYEVLGDGRRNKVPSASEVLSNYFQFNRVSLPPLIDHWSSVDENLRSKAQLFPGLRMLRQDPLECLIAFICSANNNIARIGKMVAAFCEAYGNHIVNDFYTFPTLERLQSEGSKLEEDLRSLGFGYRAKYIRQSVELLTTFGGEAWLYDLRSKPYEEAHIQLQRLPGVGAKVADCVCLMSLDHPAAVPIDTHVLQITLRSYSVPGLKPSTKSLNKALYKSVGDFYRTRFGAYAGWAHDILFCADLKHLQTPEKSGQSSEKRQTEQADKQTDKRKGQSSSVTCTGRIRAKKSKQS